MILEENVRDCSRERNVVGEEIPSMKRRKEGSEGGGEGRIEGYRRRRMAFEADAADSRGAQ